MQHILIGDARGRCRLRCLCTLSAWLAVFSSSLPAQETQSLLLARKPPVPPSPVIEHVRWDPLETIIRRAKGGDNWPITWAADDYLYSTYGDGWGFEPKVSEKLSLGLVRIAGGPQDFAGFNLRNPSIEQRGQGRQGKKSWGMLSIDGTLYMWLGHANQRGAETQLACSLDQGASWQISDWRFASLGLLGFINFAKDYSGARDQYVYAYSHNGPAADQPADEFVLLRAPKNSLLRRSSWQCWVRNSPDGSPYWSSDLSMRGAVFTHKDGCLRSAMTYNAGLGRYLWWQAIPQPAGHPDRGDTRFEGGFGIYDAPNPWGPWTTAFFTTDWDTGPGEHGDFPSKWMSEDGCRLYLVFSGEDSFSVRGAQLELSTSR